MWFGDEKTSDIILQLLPNHDSESPASPASGKPLHSVANEEVLLLKYPKHKQKSGHNSPRHDELSNHGDSRGRPLSISNLDAGQPNHKRRQPSKKRRKVHVHLDITTLHVHSAALCRCQVPNISFFMLNFPGCHLRSWSGSRCVLDFQPPQDSEALKFCLEKLYPHFLSFAVLPSWIMFVNSFQLNIWQFYCVEFFCEHPIVPWKIRSLCRCSFANYDQINRSKNLGGMHVLSNLMKVCSTVVWQDNPKSRKFSFQDLCVTKRKFGIEQILVQINVLTTNLNEGMPSYMFWLTWAVLQGMLGG